MRLYKLGAHTKTDLKVHLIWIPKYRKRLLTGHVAIRAMDLLRQIALEHGSPEDVIKAVQEMTAKRAKDMRRACEQRAKLFDKDVFVNKIREVFGG